MLLYVRCMKYIEGCGCDVTKCRRIEAICVSMQVAVYENPHQNICIAHKKNNGCRELRRNSLSKVHTRNGFLCCSKAERFISLSPERSPNSASACWNPHGLAKNQGPAKRGRRGAKWVCDLALATHLYVWLHPQCFILGKYWWDAAQKTKM